MPTEGVVTHKLPLKDWQNEKGENSLKVILIP